MSTLKNNVTVTLLYTDATTRNYTFENVAAVDLPNVKGIVKAINKNENNQYAAFYSTFISPDGAAVEKIEAARIVSIEEEVLYSD
ncbi:MAG: hypothetical protein IKS65_07625 [Bacteroidales bacterium]|nr:hypothetical protein [Bacteroidales bacterium]